MAIFKRFNPFPLKTTVNIFKYCFSFILPLILNTALFGQGRVVVNEFMSWSGCNTTSEFIELLNFGPGPMDIGCYIVTNGQYAVTIPPNTVLDPGQYYVLSGQDALSQGCGNVDSAVNVDLNWNTCNCTDKPVPTTGDGFLMDGGSANEKVVLMDPDFNVIDAASRKSTPSSSVSITTSTGGGCASRTFDLDTMDISYESINNSTGIDNSFARKVDGDCGWVKTTEISAGAPNKTGSTSSASYSFSTLSASECNGTDGSISIAVSAPDVASLFPMTYTLAFDKDSNSTFDNADQYLYGTDSSPSSIDIGSLSYGRYRITVGSSSGCNLQSFDFMIFNCYGVILNQQAKFQYIGIKGGQQLFKLSTDGNKSFKNFVLEGSTGNHFQPVHTTYSLAGGSDYIIGTPISSYGYFRLRMIDRKGNISFSRTVRISNPVSAANFLWPNPVRDNAYIHFDAAVNGKTTYTIYSAVGLMVRKGNLTVTAGKNTATIQTQNLLPGIYQIELRGFPLPGPVFYRFVKI